MHLFSASLPQRAWPTFSVICVLYYCSQVSPGVAYAQLKSIHDSIIHLIYSIFRCHTMALGIVTTDILHRIIFDSDHHTQIGTQMTKQSQTIIQFNGKYSNVGTFTKCKKSIIPHLLFRILYRRWDSCHILDVDFVFAWQSPVTFLLDPHGSRVHTLHSEFYK